MTNVIDLQKKFDALRSSSDASLLMELGVSNYIPLVGRMSSILTMPFSDVIPITDRLDNVLNTLEKLMTNTHADYSESYITERSNLMLEIVTQLNDIQSPIDLGRGTRSPTYSSTFNSYWSVFEKKIKVSGVEKAELSDLATLLGCKISLMQDQDDLAAHDARIAFLQSVGVKIYSQESFKKMWQSFAGAYNNYIAGKISGDAYKAYLNNHIEPLGGLVVSYKQYEALQSMLDNIPSRFSYNLIKFSNDCIKSTYFKSFWKQVTPIVDLHIVEESATQFNVCPWADIQGFRQSFITGEIPENKFLTYNKKLASACSKYKG